MSEPSRIEIDKEALPGLSRDSSFHGITATQFLGAFNDNLFKQLVLLVCVDYARQGGDDYQPVAMALFAIPFVMFSGFGGYFSDRIGKRQIVVYCKLAEIAVMLLGMAAFLGGAAYPGQRFLFLFIVLFLMSTQSAFFGPAKYGILPEMLRERDLPQANGVIQMTTFVAIIFGMVLAGYCKDWFQGRLWMISLMCVAIAVAGTATALCIRKTPVARPGLPWGLDALVINRQTRLMLRRDRTLLGVLLISSLFWFIGGAVQPTVNAFGRLQLNYSNGRTSMLAACLGVGIAVGCVLAGKMSHKAVNFRLVTLGAWGILSSLIVLAVLGIVAEPGSTPPAGSIPESFPELLTPVFPMEWLTRLTLTLLGVFAGFFVVPLQVFMQARPPEEQKGRMIGAMNLINWIGILLSAGFYQLCLIVLDALDIGHAAGNPQMSWVFAALAFVILPVALFYRPRDGFNRADDRN